jgi:hypothetical protein
MPTTTNYGWTTPADTDLVKDGAAAIRTLGSSIDTTLKAQIDAQIPDSIVDAKGDLISATADNTPARLAVGTNGQVLTADSTTSTGLKWATPASKVVQIVSASTTTDTSSSSITFADTTLTATITPTSASNNILVFVNQNGLQKSSADSGNAIDINLYRGATLITTITQSAGFTNSNLQLWLATASTVYLDSPATTSATTYKTQFRNPNNSASISVQKSGTRSTIVLMEVTP